MKIFHSIPSPPALLEKLQESYPITFDEIELHRDMIGAVYFLTAGQKKYALKLYRADDHEAAKSSAKVLCYLHDQGFPVAKPIMTKEETSYLSLSLPEGARLAILYPFIQGKSPTTEEDMEDLGRLTGKLHLLMEDYPHELGQLDQDHYIKAFINNLESYSFREEKINELIDYGKVLWERVRKLPRGFCHGDLHTGNLIKTEKGEIYFLDFDLAGINFPMMDVATICNATNFVKVKKEDLIQTLDNYRRFYEGYQGEKTLSQEEEETLLDFIVLHHYELLGTIPRYRLPVEGRHWFHDDFLGLHHEWVMSWEKIANQVKKERTP